MFRRNGEEILTFRVYDSVGNCVNEFTGIMKEWQREIAPTLAGSYGRTQPVASARHLN